jgi:hypothetical protein
MDRDFEQYMSEECERLLLGHWSKQNLQDKLNDIMEFLTEEVSPYCKQMRNKGRIWYYKGKEVSYPIVKIRKSNQRFLLELDIEGGQEAVSNESDPVIKQDDKEKRKHPRIDSKFMINYKLDSPLTEYDLTQTENISQGGVLLTINKKFEKGTVLAMIIRFPLLPQKIETKGEVVDAKQKGSGQFYETRVKFLDLDEEVSDRLGEFIQERLKRISSA